MVHHIITGFVDLTRGPSIQTPERTEKVWRQDHQSTHRFQRWSGGIWRSRVKLMFCKQKNTQNNQLLQVMTRIDSLNGGHVFSHEKVTYRSKQGHSEERGISCDICSFHTRCYFQSGNFVQGSARNLPKDATSEHKPCVATLIRYG